MLNFDNDFAAYFEVITEEQIVVLVNAAFKGILNGNHASFNILALYAFEDVSEVSARLQLQFWAEELVNCAFTVCAGFALEGYCLHFLFPCLWFFNKSLFIPFIIASTLAITMSSLAARAETMLPFSSSTFMTTSATAFEPPVMASNRYSLRRMFSMLLVNFCIAFKTASTGPTPVSAATYSLPFKVRRTEAVGITFMPVTTAMSHKSIIFSSPITSPITAEVNAIKSASVTILPLSPKSLTRCTISFNCSSVGWIPISSNSALIPRVPASLPATSFLVRPTNSGFIGSNVSGFSVTPRVWMPDSWANAFSPTIALFACTLIPVNDATSREVL